MDVLGISGFLMSIVSEKLLVEIHRDLCLVSDCEHDHDGCVICSVNPRGCAIVKRDIQKLVDEGTIQSQ